jgi:hypothetical protein
MAFIPAPGVAQIRTSGKVGPNPWAVVLHWYAGNPVAWTTSQVQGLAQAVHNSWITNLVPMFATDVITTLTETVDLTDTTERAGIAGPLDTPGTSPGTVPTLAACILVSHKIGARFRGGHPRTYLPGSQASATADGDTWIASNVSNFQTRWDAFISTVKTDMQAAGLATNNQCCPRYTYTYTADNNKHKFIKTRTGYLNAFPITAPSVVSHQIATQRRRLGV